MRDGDDAGAVVPVAPVQAASPLGRSGSRSAGLSSSARGGSIAVSGVLAPQVGCY